MRGAAACTGLLALAALATASAGVGCKRARNDRPFTRERVLAELRERGLDVSLPADVELPGVEEHLDLPYVHRDGRALLLDVFVPAGAGPYPGVIVAHGGGWKTGDRSMERPLARQLAARGFVTATVGYRLGPDRRFPNALFDLKAAVRWLRANAVSYRVSAARIGAVGASAGGQLVARAASALFHVGPRSAPALFINSTGPSPILPGRSEMRDRLRALGIDAEIVVFPGTPHPFWLVNPWFTPTIDAAARFLHRHLDRGA